MKNIHRASNNLNGLNHGDMIFALILESSHLKEPKKRRNFDVIETRVNMDGTVIRFESREGDSLKIVTRSKPLKITKIHIKLSLHIDISKSTIVPSKIYAFGRKLN